MTCSKCGNSNASGVYCQKCGNAMVADPQFPAQNNFSQGQWLDAQRNIEKLQRENADLHGKYAQIAGDHQVLYAEHNALQQRHVGLGGNSAPGSTLMRTTKDGTMVATLPETASDFPTNPFHNSVNPNDRGNYTAQRGPGNNLSLANDNRGNYTFVANPGIGVVPPLVSDATPPGSNFPASDFPSNPLTPINPSDRTFAAEVAVYGASGYNPNNPNIASGYVGSNVSDTPQSDYQQYSNRNVIGAPGYNPNAPQSGFSADATGYRSGTSGFPKTMKKLNSADRDVNNRGEEDLAKADGFTVATDAHSSTFPFSPQGAGFPKTMSNPMTKATRDVQNEGEEDQARVAGFTVVRAA